MRTILVLDFDGTLTTSDVGDDLCDRFAPPAWREIDAAWVRGELSLPEAQRRMWGMARVDREDAVATARAIGRLRPGLAELLDGAAARGAAVWLASGGFDFYIDALLGAERPRFARVECNHMRFEGDRLFAEFPTPAPRCGRCAVCKGEACERARATGARVVFAGDGHSDRCAIGRADALWAVRGSHLDAAAAAAGQPARAFERLDELLAAL